MASDKLESVVSYIAGCKDSSEIGCGRKELIRIGDKAVACFLITVNNRNSCSGPYSQTIICDKNGEFICSAHFLPYMKETQGAIYSAIVRRADELNMLPVVKRWNSALEGLIPPSQYKD